MPNPIKIAKLVSKQVKKRDAIRTAVRKKSYSAAPAKLKSLTPTTGKAKSIKKREVAEKNAYSMQGQGGISVFKKATSNKKLGASNRAGRGSLKSTVKQKVKQERKTGLAQNTKFFNSEIKNKGRTPFQFSPGEKKIPVKRRGK